MSHEATDFVKRRPPVDNPLASLQLRDRALDTWVDLGRIANRVVSGAGRRRAINLVNDEVIDG